MAKKKITGNSVEIPSPGKYPAIKLVTDSEKPVISQTDPHIIPDKVTDETPPMNVLPMGKALK